MRKRRRQGNGDMATAGGQADRQGGRMTATVRHHKRMTSCSITFVHKSIITARA